MTWKQTYSGQAFDLARPRAEDVNLMDIFWHLSLINRYNGATGVPYSVATHSWLVARRCAQLVLPERRLSVQGIGR